MKRRGQNTLDLRFNKKPVQVVPKLSSVFNPRRHIEVGEGGSTPYEFLEMVAEALIGSGYFFLTVFWGSIAQLLAKKKIDWVSSRHGAMTS